MVNFIADEQLEGIAMFSNQIPSRMVCRHGQRDYLECTALTLREDFLFAPVVETHLAGKRIHQPCIPLV